MRKCRLVVRVKELYLLTLLPRTKSKKIRLGTQREDQAGHGNTVSVKWTSCLLTYRNQCGTCREEKDRPVALFSSGKGRPRVDPPYKQAPDSFLLVQPN